MAESDPRECSSHQVALIQRIRDGKKSGWYCRPCANQAATRRRIESPDRWLDSKLWTFYRIRLSDFRRMLAEQGGRCAACRRIPDAKSNGMGGTGLNIDHDHRCCPSQRSTQGGGGKICGKCVRGLLCQQCNVALGMVSDDADRLRALIGYLEK